MSLYTVAETCKKLLYQFSMPTDTDFLSFKMVDIHVKYAEKLDIDFIRLQEVLFPLEDLATQLQITIDPFAKKPTNKEEESIYSIFKKILAFYILSHKMADTIRTENGSYFLNMIYGELEFLLSDIENNYMLHLVNNHLKKHLLLNLKDCLKRLSTIIQEPELIQNTDSYYFINKKISEINLRDISEMINLFLAYINIECLSKINIVEVNDWFQIINDITEQCNVIFYDSEFQFTDTNNMLALFLNGNIYLTEAFSKIQDKNKTLENILLFYIYTQFILSREADKIEEAKFLDLIKLSENLVSSTQHINSMLDLDPTQVSSVLIKIHKSLLNMKNKGIRLKKMTIFDLDIHRIQLNDILDTLSDLCINLTMDEINNQQCFEIHIDIINYIIKNPINFNEYIIPHPYENAIKNYLCKNYTHTETQKNNYQILDKIPLTIDLLSHYYFIYSLSIHVNFISQSLIMTLLYYSLDYQIKKNTLYFKQKSDFFKYALLRIHEYYRYLCDRSTVNAFILRASLLDFSIVGSFSQGTKEYFEQEDGLCAGYVYQLAEYILIDQRGNVAASRSYRWNIKAQRSPFDMAYKSPFKQVIANQRTYEFQSKKLHEVTDAFQKDYATSPLRFNSGAEIAEKTLEILRDNPQSILLLGMFQIGHKIGHATACFIQDELLHFFCATHCWITIPYRKADPHLHAFLYLIYSQLEFFNQYTHFVLEIIYKTWEKPIVEEHNFHREYEEKDMPFAYDFNTCIALEKKATTLIDKVLASINNI